MRYEVRDNGQLLVVLPTNSFAVLQEFISKHEDLQYKFLLKNIKYAIENNMPAIDLFRMGATPVVSRVEHSNYKTQLGKMQQYFIGSEEYEFAGQCKELMSKLEITELLDSC